MQKKSERLFRIFNRLKSKPQSVDQLRRWCSANNIPAGQRTLYRYLEELRTTTIESGFRLVTIGEGTGEKQWQGVPENSTDVTSLGDAINGFHLLSRLSGVHVQTIGLDYISRFTEEMLRTLDKDDMSSSVFNHLIVTGWGEVSYSKQDRIKLKAILNAIEGRVVVRVETIKQLQVENSINARNWRLHQLVSHRGSIFVAATPNQSDMIHFLDVESILEVTFQQKRYRKQLTKQQVEQELVSRFGITASNGPSYVIKLGFLPSDNDKQSGYLNPFLEKRLWHSNQRFYKDMDGLLVLEFTAPLSRELVGWIMMWLDHVKVIEPPELIHLIGNKLDDMKKVVNGGRPFFSSPDIF